MKAFSVISTCDYQSKSLALSRICMTTMIIVAACIVICQPSQTMAFDSGQFPFAGQAFESQAPLHWGHDRTWRLAYSQSDRLGANPWRSPTAALDDQRETADGFDSSGSRARCDIQLAGLCRNGRI